MTDSVLQGSLASFKLPDVLSFVSSAHKSGTLTLHSDGHESYIFFQNGALVFAGSNQEPFRLGAILQRKKLLTRDDCMRVDEMMRHNGGRFGQLAVAQGFFSEGQLQDYLKVQVSEILYDAFVWTSGTFDFAEGIGLPSHAVTISIDLSNLIMEGARRIEEWEQCVNLLPDKNVVFRVVSSPNSDKITLTVEEWKILFMINGVRTLEDLAHDAYAEPFSVYRVVYGLLANHLIEAVPPMSRAEDTGGITGPMAVPVMPESDDDTMCQTVKGPLSGIPTVRDDTSLLVSPSARVSRHEVVKTIVAQLTVMSGESSGRMVPLTQQEYLIGRHHDNNIQINDLGISGFHARIYRGPEGYVIEDLKSRNGVWLNLTRVFHAILQDQDKLRLGATDFLYTILYDGTRAS
ncbi:MAG: DUF4388 domain-containing protein [Thermoanaerobaculia bacterium]